MNILNYLLLLIISFFGVIIGWILCRIAYEELKSVVPKLKYINVILISTIFWIITYKVNKIYSIICTLILFIALILLKDKYDDKWTYASMSALLYASTMVNQILNVAILIFIYGVSASTITLNVKTEKELKKNKTLKRILLKYCYYLIFGIIIFIVMNYIVL